jgi:hypothetical protein
MAASGRAIGLGLDARANQFEPSVDKIIERVAG